MKLSNEAKIGILFTVVVIVLGTLHIKASDYSFSKKGYYLKVQFKNIEGISMNAPVMLNGLEVGHVEDIVIDDAADGTRMILVCWIEETAKLREGANAYVKNMGFLGEKYVGLMTGEGKNFLQPGSVIVGKEPADMDKLLTDGQEIASNIKEISINLNERLQTNKESIDQIIKNLDTSMVHIASITENLDERLTVNEKNIDDILAHLRSAVVNLDQFTYDLKLHPWKLLYRSKEQREKSIDMMKEKDK